MQEYPRTAGQENNYHLVQVNPDVGVRHFPCRREPFAVEGSALLTVDLYAASLRYEALTYAHMNSFSRYLISKQECQTVSYSGRS